MSDSGGKSWLERYVPGTAIVALIGLGGTWLATKEPSAPAAPPVPSARDNVVDGMADRVPRLEGRMEALEGQARQGAEALALANRALSRIDRLQSQMAAESPAVRMQLEALRRDMQEIANRMAPSR